MMSSPNNSDSNIFGISGPFFVGCNYWASHAGTAMWADWRPDMVELDLKRLADAGIQVMRVFPLWPDFQPITTIYTGGGRAIGQRHGEESLPDTDLGRAGLSPVMLERFLTLSDMAGKHNIKLVVGLITGWMSGRLFVPPALQGRKILTDPEAIRWQVRFVDGFVRHTKHHTAIAAWDLGNECNVMENVTDSHQAYLWTSSIANAIRRADPSRSIVSGMHSLVPAGKWTMQDQGELTDILTTHPYPFWTQYMDFDPIDSMRPMVHATVESLFYADIGRKPCFAEEMGTMGPMVCSEAVAAAFGRTSLLSQWAHGLPGLMWWCASDQTKLQHSPYDSNACENELGLMAEDGRVKPVLKALTDTRKALAKLPLETLPNRVVEAVCILNTQQDHWAVGLGAFLLAKQAGFDVSFSFEDQDLPDAPLYLLPCVTGVGGVPKQLWQALLEKVRAGATLWVSSDNGYLLNFTEVTGLTVANRHRRSNAASVSFQADGQPVEITIPASFRLDFLTGASTVLATEADGNPVWSRSSYGKGVVHFFSLPLEKAMVTQADTTWRPEDHPLAQVYREMSAEIRSTSRVVDQREPLVGVTEHSLADHRRVVVFINHSAQARPLTLKLRQGWKVAECWYGQPAQVQANDAVVLLVTKG